MADLGSPEPPHRGRAAALIVFGVGLTTFAAWWFLTADTEQVDVDTPAAVTTVADSAAPQP